MGLLTLDRALRTQIRIIDTVRQSPYHLQLEWEALSQLIHSIRILPLPHRGWAKLRYWAACRRWLREATA